MGDSLDETRKILLDALRGDASARNDLLERVRPRVVLWVAARLSPRLRALVDPEDIAQEVLLAAHKALDTLRTDEQAAFHRWLFRIAENRIRDLADHHGAKKRQPGIPLVPSQTTPGTVTMRQEQVRLVVAAIGRLSDDYRLVLQLRQLEQLGVPEVAERMERTENAVRILHTRALKALREALDGKD